jgi:YHS domain-containing protein
MLARFLIWTLALLVVWRALRSIVAGIIQGATAPSSPQRGGGPPEKGELMVRDPVCGTFVLPSRAISLNDRGGTHHFCSDRCRQAYQHR